MRLSGIFNSKEAHRHLWRESLMLSGTLSAILWVAGFLVRGSLEWAYPSPENHFLGTARRGVPGGWIWLGLWLCFVFAFLALVSDYYRWCLLTWAKRESAHHVLKQEIE
jgi:hypothetical protein